MVANSSYRHTLYISWTASGDSIIRQPGVEIVIKTRKRNILMVLGLPAHFSGQFPA